MYVMYVWLLAAAVLHLQFCDKFALPILQTLKAPLPQWDLMCQFQSFIIIYPQLSTAFSAQSDNIMLMGTDGELFFHSC